MINSILMQRLQLNCSREPEHKISLIRCCFLYLCDIVIKIITYLILLGYLFYFNFKKIKIKHIHIAGEKARVFCQILSVISFLVSVYYETNYVFSVVTVKMKQFNLLSVKG